MALTRLADGAHRVLAPDRAMSEEVSQVGPAERTVALPTEVADTVRSAAQETAS